MRKEEKNRQESKLPFVIVGVVVAAALLIVVILFVMAGFAPDRRRAGMLGYEIVFDNADYEYQRLTLSTDNDMERYQLRGITGDNPVAYVSVSVYDPSLDLQESLDGLDSEGDYQFAVSEGTFGKGNYPATVVTFTDTSYEGAIQYATYYYMKDRELLVTAYTDDAHRKEIEEMIASFQLTE